MNRKYLGKTSENFKNCPNQSIYITKHSWDCDWYWGFGYIGNGGMHTHFDGVFLNNAPTDVKEIFKSTKITQELWWILRDLFIQAYALKECAAVYHYGGHQTSKEGITDIIKNQEMEKTINKDLETVLNKIWEVIEGI